MLNKQCPHKTFHHFFIRFALASKKKEINTTLFHADNNSIMKSKTSCNAVGFQKAFRTGDEQSTVTLCLGQDDVAFTIHPCRKKTYAVMFLLPLEIILEKF